MAHLQINDENQFFAIDFLTILLSQVNDVDLVRYDRNVKFFS